MHMAKSRIVSVNAKIAEAATGCYRKIEDGVTGGYRKLESGAVNGFNRMTDKFVERFLTREGESVAEAKKRLNGKEMPEK